MTYELYIIRKAQKELGKIEHATYTRIVESIRQLADDPRPSGCKKLVAREGWRIRIGNYRVIYEINDERETVTVMHIGHRRDVYS